MSEITTYPKMNEEIKKILRISSDMHELYAVVRLEELESQLALAREALESISLGLFSTRNAKLIAQQTLAKLGDSK